MYKKKGFVTFVMILLFLIAIIGIIKINIINSEILSPINEITYSTEDEKKLSEAYLDFITDESYVKIYKMDDFQYLVKIGDNDFKITNQWSIIDNMKNIFNKIEEFISRL